MSEREDLHGDALEAMLPHRAPFRMVDRLVTATEREAIATRRITAEDPLLGAVMPASLLVEGMAQTAALMTGAGIGTHRGYLVAVRNVVFESSVVAGDTLELHARRTGTFGALHRVDAEARVGERVVARGELTFSVERS